MARYKIVAHLIDPELQDRKTLTKEYLRDFDFIERGGKGAMELLYNKYPIDSNAYEDFNSTDEFKLEQDADGIYLFKRCDGMKESKKRQNTVKLNESQLRKIVAESVKKVLKESFGEQVHRYVMSYSQAEGGWAVVYARDIEEAEEKFENGDYEIEDEG